MSWLETDAMDQKMRFIMAYREGAEPMAELCRIYGISRQTGYKYVHRYETEGAAGLEERSRAPHRHGLAMPEWQAKAIVALRERRPTWGARKLLQVLMEEHPRDAWPVLSTIHDFLKREGLVPVQRRRRRASPTAKPLMAVARPNDVWSADFKGWFRSGDGKRCNPLTISDAYSRYLLACDLLGRETFLEAQPVFEAVFCEYGLPIAMRTDNGTPFASTGAGGLSALSVWWLQLGIRLERIDPGQPQQNGRHERMHRTLKEDVASPPAKTYEEQRTRMDTFRQIYNQERPHDALGLRTPGRVYHRSPRSYPRALREPGYGVEEAVRKVRSNGEIKWGGDKIFVSEVLVGEPVGISESEEGHWRVRYFDIELGIIDRNTRKLRRPARPGGSTGTSARAAASAQVEKHATARADPPVDYLDELPSSQTGTEGTLDAT